MKMKPKPSEAEVEAMKDDIEWARCLLAPWPVDQERQSWAVRNRLLNLLLAVLAAANDEHRWMPMIEVSGGLPAWMRIGSDTLLFERSDDDVWGYRTATCFVFEPFVAQSEVALLEWVGQVARDFIAAHMPGARGVVELGGPGRDPPWVDR